MNLKGPGGGVFRERIRGSILYRGGQGKSLVDECQKR